MTQAVPGKKIPDFKLPATSGKTLSPADWQREKRH